MRKYPKLNFSMANRDIAVKALYLYLGAKRFDLVDEFSLMSAFVDIDRDGESEFINMSDSNASGSRPIF